MEMMNKYSLLLNVDHGTNVKVCLRTPYKVQIHMVVNGKTVIPKVLHQINPIGTMLGKITHNNRNGHKIPNHHGLINRMTNGHKINRTNRTIGKTSRTNGNHPKGIGNLRTNGRDLNNGLTKILVLHNYHLYPHLN